jgi:hypothetical protein
MFYFFVNCNQVCSSLKYILKFTIFCIVKNPLSLCVFIPNGFPYIFFHRKKSITVSCYILYFSNTILIFRLFFCRLPPQSGAGDMEMPGVRPLIRPSEICCKRSKFEIGQNSKKIAAIFKMSAKTHQMLQFQRKLIFRRFST